jgi:hypothetical protein
MSSRLIKAGEPESFDGRPALPLPGSPATPLSRVHEIGGFASPSHDGFALNQSGLICGAFPGVADLTGSLLRQAVVKRVTARNAKCLDAATCEDGNTCFTWGALLARGWVRRRDHLDYGGFEQTSWRHADACRHGGTDCFTSSWRP